MLSPFNTDLDRSISSQYSIIKDLFKAGLPKYIDFTAMILRDLITFYIIASVAGIKEIFPLAIATSIIYHFGISIGYSITQQIAPQLAQSLEYDNFDKYKRDLKCSKWLIVLTLIAINSITYYFPLLFNYLGLEHSLITQIRHIILFMMPSTIANVLYYFCSFQIKGHFYQSLVQIYTTSIHLGISYLLFNSPKGNSPIFNACYSRGISDTIGLASIFVMLCLQTPDEIKQGLKQSTSSVKKTKHQSLQLFSFIVKILDRALPQIFRWMLLAIPLILFLYLKNENIVIAYTLTNLVGMVLTIPSNVCSQGLAIVLPKFARNKEASKVKEYMIGAVMLKFVIAPAIIMYLLFNCNFIPEKFSKEAKINTIMSDMLIAYCCQVYFEVLSKDFEGYLCTLQKRVYIFWSYLMSFGIFGPLMSGLASIYFKFGYKGIWGGIILTHFLYICFLLIKVFQTKLTKSVDEISEKFWIMQMEHSQKITLAHRNFGDEEQQRLIRNDYD